MTKRGPRKNRGVYERVPGSGIWYVEIFDEFGKRHRIKVGSKSLAIKVQRRKRNEADERRYMPETSRRQVPILSAAIDDFFARRNRKTSADYKRYRKLWLKLLGDKPLSAYMPADIERAVAGRRGKLKDSSINRELTFLRAVFNLAIEDGILSTANPVRRRIFVKEDLFARVRHLLPEEEAALRKHVPEDEWPILEVAIGTGIRREGVFALPWASVDFANDSVTAPAAKGSSTYRVPLSKALRDVLGALPSRLKSTWVFPNERGTSHVNAHNWVSRILSPALKAAGISDFRFHDFRHTFATRLGQSGARLLEIQTLLGHKSPTMTQRYAHVVEAYRRRAVERMAETRGATPGATEVEGQAAMKGRPKKTPKLRAIPSEPSGTRTPHPLLKRRRRLPLGMSRRTPCLRLPTTHRTLRAF